MPAGHKNLAQQDRSQENLTLHFRQRTKIPERPLLILYLCFLAFSASAANPIRFAGAPAELVISQISERTLRIELSPLDGQGHPYVGPPSTILVPLSSTEKFRSRDLPRPREFRAGHLLVKVQPEPLSISVRRADGKLVQELSFEESTNGAMSFRSEAPVLGLGEGGPQFDRRGLFYPMLNGQLAPLLATHGATIPVPFLIGADGWALFVHRPWGEFDLREGKGKFFPGKEARGKQSLELFVVSAPEPADALAEYIRLTGRPVMPPKWALGYFQSHRTLAGPEEPLQIARTSRKTTPLRRPHLPRHRLLH